jgi:hypothetical protein
MTAVATSDRNDRTLLVEHVAPGQIRVLVNGVLIDLVESWDYTDASAIIPLDVASLAHFGVRVRAGQKVSVAIQTTRFATQRTWAAYQQQN